MAISKMSNGFYTFSDNHFKAMRKQDLINYIRNIEKNWENSLITNDIQYANCKKLLVEERNKAIDEFAERLKSDEFQKYNLDMVFETSRDLSYSDCIDAFHEYIDEVSEQLKDGGENEY